MSKNFEAKSVSAESKQANQEINLEKQLKKVDIKIAALKQAVEKATSDADFDKLDELADRLADLEEKRKSLNPENSDADTVVDTINEAYVAKATEQVKTSEGVQELEKVATETVDQVKQEVKKTGKLDKIKLQLGAGALAALAALGGGIAILSGEKTLPVEPAASNGEKVEQLDEIKNSPEIKQATKALQKSKQMMIEDYFYADAMRGVNAEGKLRTDVFAKYLEYDSSEALAEVYALTEKYLNGEIATEAEFWEQINKKVWEPAMYLPPELRVYNNKYDTPVDSRFQIKRGETGYWDYELKLMAVEIIRLHTIANAPVALAEIKGVPHRFGFTFEEVAGFKASESKE